MVIMDGVVMRNRIYNPNKMDCPVSSMFNNLYGADSFQSEQQIPEGIGKGYGKRYILGPFMEIFISDTTFYENLTIREEIHVSPHYGLAFCLKDPLHWRMDDSRKEYLIGCEESYIFNGLSGNTSCTYYADKRFFGISLLYNPEVIGDLIACMGNKTVAQKCNENMFYVKKLSPNIRLILNEMICCQYCGDVKKIYLEGKALELLAVYLDELVFENGRSDTLLKLSPADMEALYHARRILDENIVLAPTIGQLSRLTCLNEYKLKAGFRKVFGMPVHSYIIDKRLELARFLMAEQRLGVTETALLVGYSNTNYFTEKFKSKYGIKPSEYRKLQKPGFARNPF
ncbi:helix-turn-helix transcriptional regulator [Clostridium sp. Marseille-P2415]|uniref:helix-turn-helix transcriptional regulator n=1 Tax=Clostridium sp. Marseille-P2415 TaxID=1805471 RepID=UPI001F1DA171|nr:AraC family transcriptional regulator [Clostridium sp. Marseille-P2415]